MSRAELERLIALWEEQADEACGPHGHARAEALLHCAGDLRDVLDPPRVCCTRCNGDGAYMVEDTGPITHGDAWGACHEVQCRTCNGKGTVAA